MTIPSDADLRLAADAALTKTRASAAWLKSLDEFAFKEGWYQGMNWVLDVVETSVIDKMRKATERLEALEKNRARSKYNRVAAATAVTIGVFMLFGTSGGEAQAWAAATFCAAAWLLNSI